MAEKLDPKEVVVNIEMAVHQQMDSMTMRGPEGQKLDAEGVSLYPPHDGLVNLHGPRVVSQRE